MSTNENTPISGQFWDWMQSYWHKNRDFPPAHPDWRKKADLVNGKVPAGQLPSYVDDVLEFDSYTSLPQTGEKGKIYITTKDNKQFRWGGSAYIEINSGEKVGSKIINGSYNANDLSTNSITYGYSVANAPSTVGAHSFSILNLDTANPDYKMQLGFDGDTNEMFSRIKSNGNWNDWSKYATSSQLKNIVTTDTDQDVTGTKSYINNSGNSSLYDNKLHVKGTNGSKAGISFWSDDVGQLIYWNTGFHFKNQFDTAYQFAKASAFIKDGSDNSYILLGGGGHKPVSEFVLPYQLDGYMSKAIIPNDNFNTISGNVSSINRANNPGPGVKSLYSPMLHMGGYDTMSQLQIQYANGNDVITGELNYRGGFNNTWGVWRTAYDNVNLPNPATESWVSNNYIPNAHPSYGITGTNIYQWSGYKRHEYNMLIQPNQVNTLEMEFGFGSWNNNGTLPYADYMHFGGYADSSGGNQNLISFRKNGFGLRQWQGTKGSPANYASYVDYWNTENLNPLTLDTPQTIIHQKTFNQGIGLTSGQKINLAGYGDPAHYIKRFDDDTDGFGISTGFAVKPYNDSSKNLLLVDGSGTYVNGNRVWDLGNFNPELKAERENNAVGIGFEGGNIENPYMKHNAGAAYLATKNWITGSFIPKTHPAAGIGQSQINGWNNSISQSSASQEVILEDDTLKIQPDEFPLEGSGSYDIASRKKLVHVLLREGKEVNIRELVRRQSIVVFNFSKDPLSLNIEGLKPYPLSPEMQVTLYVSDEGEVLLYNETAFKKLQ